MEWFRTRSNHLMRRSELVLPAAMVAVECTEVIVTTVSKSAMTNGMSNFVFVVYYNALASLVFLPSMLCRRQASLTRCLLCKFFLLSLIGSSAQMLKYTGIKYSSPTLASTFRNLVPILTYLLAVILRTEDANLGSVPGLAKLFGAIVAVLGAITVGVYKGHVIFKSPSSSNTLDQLFSPQDSNWAIGGLFLAVQSLLVSIHGIFETALIEEFPEKTTILFFYLCFSTVLSWSFSLMMERNPEAWKVKADIGLIAIICSAVFDSVFRNGVHAWGYQKRGALYVAMFKPLGIAIAVVLGVLFLGEPLYLGSVIGAVIITIGFYVATWGKARDRSFLPDNGICEPSPERAQLLQNRYNAKGEM